MRNKYMDKYIDELVQKYKKERIKRWKENCSAYFRELNPPREWQYARLFFKYCLEEKKISFEYGSLIPKKNKCQKLPSFYSLIKRKIMKYQTFFYK